MRVWILKEEVGGKIYIYIYDYMMYVISNAYQQEIQRFIMIEFTKPWQTNTAMGHEQDISIKDLPARDVYHKYIQLQWIFH